MKCLYHREHTFHLKTYQKDSNANWIEKEYYLIKTIQDLTLQKLTNSGPMEDLH